MGFWKKIRHFPWTVQMIYLLQIKRQDKLAALLPSLVPTEAWKKYSRLTRHQLQEKSRTDNRMRRFYHFPRLRNISCSLLPCLFFQRVDLLDLCSSKSAPLLFSLPTFLFPGPPSEILSSYENSFPLACVKK